GLRRKLRKEAFGRASERFRKAPKGGVLSGTRVRFRRGSEGGSTGLVGSKGFPEAASKDVFEGGFEGGFRRELRRVLRASFRRGLSEGFSGGWHRVVRLEING